jgi:hypothetical protein
MTSRGLSTSQSKGKCRMISKNFHRLLSPDNQLYHAQKNHNVSQYSQIFRRQKKHYN